MKLRTTKLKPKLDPHQYITKKQRTKRPRRIRWQISPILISRLRSAPPQKSQGFHAFSVNSIPSLYFGDELSCDSSRVTFKSSATKRKLRETEGIEKIEDDPFRRITRSYYKQKENERKENEVEVSESSCVESKSRVDCVAPGKRRSSKLKKRAEDSKEIQISEGSTSVTKSEISSLHQNLSFNGKSLENISSEGKDNDTFSIVSGVESCLSHGTIERVKRTETELSEISKHDAFSIDESVVEQKPKSLGAVEADLACAERISYDDVVTEYSSSHETAFSELQSEVFLGSSSDIEFSDYTPSIFFDSGSEFSEKSVDDSPPSQTYSLLLEFRQKFSRSSVPLDMIRCPFTEAEYLLHSSFVKFEIQDDEESYQRFRERERRQLFLHDYVELYCSTTEYGSLILEQRLQMVHWIVEQSTAKEFQLETTFLGVSLLDRFLSKGFFKNKRSLQIVGIACLTLATRIEENQPYNSVRQKNFPMESSAYSRFEVVAMEWLVQEVLNFQCFLPTIHNFMWFYLKAARADAKVEKKARYLAKLALSDHEHLRYWPSTVAAGLVILASLESDQIESYQRVIEVHVRTKENDLRECMKTMEWLLQYVN
ncbi:cyclin-SDS [Manihot esculenta]|uniref:B-like cyclin n=2 Tax=Manihot esculenta TaxID=3983 RepID=A0A2C9U720_MANES|nr:cyclin-SDS [Manihot esculenta]KAG8634789.1 hypothetical protein MANES_17G085800v8 [Manihot esculenta]OAY25334.1 hypothetical protein MANES_17G085800v8 [Manihot esculenta]